MGLGQSGFGVDDFGDSGPVPIVSITALETLDDSELPNAFDRVSDQPDRRKWRVTFISDRDGIAIIRRLSPGPQTDVYTVPVFAGLNNAIIQTNPAPMTPPLSSAGTAEDFFIVVTSYDEVANSPDPNPVTL